MIDNYSLHFTIKDFRHYLVKHSVILKQELKTFFKKIMGKFHSVKILATFVVNQNFFITDIS